MRSGIDMGYDRAAPKRPVNLNLNADLVEQCRSGVANLSAPVEGLPAADLARREANAEAERARTEQAVDAFAALYAAHGSLSGEIQTL
jgi:antitoxin CcdA